MSMTIKENCHREVFRSFKLRAVRNLLCLILHIVFRIFFSSILVMPLYKCCVGGCDSTSNTHRLFCMPMNDHLRNFWMSLLVPTNPSLLVLTKNQLMTKRVCEKHFDETQFDPAGVRIRYSYLCLLTENEIAHGVPLAKGCNVLDDHIYCQRPDDDDSVGGLIIIKGDMSREHQYSLPSTSYSVSTSHLANQGDISADMTIEIAECEQEESKTNALGSAVQPVSDKDKIYKSKQKSTSRKSRVPFNSKTRRYIRQCTKIASNTQSAQKQEENLAILANFEKLDKKAKAFLFMQLKLATRNKMARRFTLEDKLFGLALMKQSPKGYKLLEKMFALPNKRTLARLSNKIAFECGINKNIFDYIKVTVQNWDIKKRLCSVVFDEVALTPHLTYDESRDKIIGFVEIAGERIPKLADHALVVMIRGICSSWRQSIAYYFCEGTISSTELLGILNAIIPLLSATGLKPLALICDQGSTFRSCFKMLTDATARLCSSQGRENDGRIHIAGQDLFLLHDPPHLLKSIRNNFLTKDILFEQKRASWEDILYIYDLDSKLGHTRALPKLTSHHVAPKNKMKVKTATQVLSARTAAMLNYTDALHKRLNNPLPTMEATAAVVTFFDDLFDSVNGSPGGTKGKLRCAVKPTSPHKAFWQKSIEKLRNITYIDTKSKLAIQAGKSRHVRVPSLEGWIITLKSFLGLSKLLFSEYGVEYFYPRLLNQDPLENFFGRIRAMNYRNNNPDANTFMFSFKSLVISNILSPHSKFSNCEEDDGDTLIDLNYLFKSQIENQDTISLVDPLLAPSSSKWPLESEATELEKTVNEKVRVQISAYTAGYICRKISKKFNCIACAKTYTSKEIQGIHLYISHREYKRLQNNNLAYPNEKILRLYRENSQTIHNYLNEYGHKNDIKKNIIHNISKCDMSWLGCEIHSLDVINFYASLVNRLQCHNWCNIANKILNGKIEEKYVMKMPNMQQQLLKKYKTHRIKRKIHK